MQDCDGLTADDPEGDVLGESRRRDRPVAPLVAQLCRSRMRCRARTSGAPTAMRSTRPHQPQAFISAMKRLSQQNMAEEHPSQLVQWLFCSHSPIRERIDAARRWARN